MKSNIIYLAAVLMLAASINACKKDKFQRTQSESNHLSSQEKNAYQATFAKAFAKAINEEPSLRTFIKTEALKQFDKDHDVLFQMVKDIRLSGTSIFYEMVAKYAEDREKFDMACDKLPLLTILVPTVPDFSPETWDAGNQIPVIAVEPDAKVNSGKVSLYDHTGKNRDLAPQDIPSFPVLVVKNNERVVLHTPDESYKPAHKVIVSESKPFFSNEKFTFKFWDEAFDGLTSKSTATRIGIFNPSLNYYGVDKVNIDAYNSGSEWHRDFIYYGITPNVPNGKFTNRYFEYIKNFRFINGDDWRKISEHSDDPKPYSYTTNTNSPTLWTEGRFEFAISILINAKNGVGAELRKGFTAAGSDLFSLQWEPAPSPGLWRLAGASPKPFDPNIQIVPWDLEQYGNAWKFIVAEYDPTEEITRTVTHTSTYGGNFEISLPTSEKIKVGAKFGASATSQTVTQYQVKTTTGSDDLKEGILEFHYPVVTNITELSAPDDAWIAHTFEVSTGFVTLSVEPIKIY